MKKFLAIVLLLVIVAAGIGYLVLRSRYTGEVRKVRANAESRLTAVRRESMTAVRDLAADLVRTLSVTLADDIARKDFPAVQAETEAIVKGRRVAGILVLADDGTVVAATDTRYQGRKLDDPATRQALAATAIVVSETPPAPGQLEVDAPVRSAGRRVATLRVFFDVGGPRSD